jgi:hypothetical protein
VFRKRRRRLHEPEGLHEACNAVKIATVLTQRGEDCQASLARRLIAGGNIEIVAHAALDECAVRPQGAVA